MCGNSLGRQRGFAEKAVTRYVNDGNELAAKTLRKHLKLVQAALCLREASIASLPFAELKALLVTFKKENVDFPSEIKMALLRRRLDDCKDV